MIGWCLNELTKIEQNIHACKCMYLWTAKKSNNHSWSCIFVLEHNINHSSPWWWAEMSETYNRMACLREWFYLLVKEFNVKSVVYSCRKRFWSMIGNSFSGQIWKGFRSQLGFKIYNKQIFSCEFRWDMYYFFRSLNSLHKYISHNI